MPESDETIIVDEKDSQSPMKGSLLMFPPLWPWLHQGMKPINQPKYIVGSYLHYTLDN